MVRSPDQKMIDRRGTAPDRVADYTICDMLRAAAARDPESPAIIASQRRPLSHRRLWQQVEGTVAWLNAAGIGRGDRVAMVLPNGAEMAAAFLGVSAAATSAPLNPNYGAEELGFRLAELEAEAQPKEPAWRLPT